MPENHYALAEQVAGETGPDVLTLRVPEAIEEESGGVAVATSPPRVEITETSEISQYVSRQRSLVIRHVSNHRIVAMIEIVSPGNKASPQNFRTFLRKATSAISQGVHLLVIDLFPPTARDPQGIHSAIWQELSGNHHTRPEKQLTLASYAAGSDATAYVEPRSGGEEMVDMPMFLTRDRYVETPLATTYATSFGSLPKYYREALEDK